MREVEPEIHHALGRSMHENAEVRSDPDGRFVLLFVRVCVFA
jgi:secreted PhoX family phosphatase